MMYTINDIEKILNFKTWDDKKKIDELLQIDARIYANQGIDSTKVEKENGKIKSRKIYKAIKEIDKPLGDSFLQLMDK
jgi:CRISPR/Cas system CSM-associated protein Csm2 small subunit